MVVKSNMRFDPEVMLSAPRRSAGIPSPNGNRVLYTTSTYSFASHRKDDELRVMEVATGESRKLAHNDGISDPVWLDDSEFVCVRSLDHGESELCVGKAGGDAKFTAAGKIDAPISSLKVVRLGDAGYAVIFSAPAAPDGKLVNPETAKKTYSNGRLYTKLYVRHWDRYETKNKNALWYGRLSYSSAGGWRLGSIHNALAGLGVESPIPPFGGTDHFDVCKHGIIFVAKDPNVDPALNVKCNVYLLHIESWAGPPSLAQQVVVPGFEGAASSPVFNRDGTQAAFLQMAARGYEADKSQIFVVPFATKAGGMEVKAQRAFADTGIVGTWDRSPESICFTADGKYLLALAEDYGQVKLFMLRSDLSQSHPFTLFCDGSVSDCKPLHNGHIFVSGSSLINNSFYAVVVPVLGSSPEAGISSTTAWTNTSGNQFGLSAGQLSWIKSPANNPHINKDVWSLVVRPHKIKAKGNPVAYVIHGGPQSSWTNAWSTRWNLALLAEQGYIVVAPNPTGSTGYGQAFTDAIEQNWGGDPYEDIVNVFDWVSENMPEADNGNAVALGASYGGYMMNWIQGHDLGRKFKCLVCHDGITSFAGSLLGSDELYFPFHDLGGLPWYNPKATSARPKLSGFPETFYSDWRRWDPSEFFAEWSTPELVIHSSKDYRLPVSEGLAAFNVLQARGVESQFLTFPTENHWVLSPENSLAWHKVVYNWINKHVGLPPYSTEDPEDDALFGGLKEDDEEPVSMVTQGQVAM